MNALRPSRRRESMPQNALATALLAEPVTHVTTAPVVLIANQFEAPQIGLAILPHGFVTETGFLVT